MPFEPNKARKIFEGKLQGKRIYKNDPHYWYEIEVPEPILPIEIKCPFNHKKEIDNSLLGLMAKEMGITIKFLKEILGCTKNLDDLIIQLGKMDRRDYY
jgi:hypothetical protein